MSVYDYMDALKLGKKEYRNAVGNGEYPYLPVLDEILKHVEVEKEVKLGVVDIPLNRVIGTSTAGRTQAFARNFMPLLEYGTEFGAKWATLSDAQVEEGIRDPIQVYEYMNRFYVVEGNKRVSVLKFFGAVTIAGNVIRKVPKQTEDLDNKIYYEFMDFYEITGINSLYVSRLGAFSRLLELAGGTETVWSAEQRKEFNAVYQMFRAAYMAKGGAKLPIRSGDAFVAFMDIYGYDAMKEMTPSQMRDNIVKIWNEFVMLTQGERVDLVMDPKEEKDSLNKKIIHYLLPTREKKYQAAFLYDKTPEQSDWIYAHELGRLYLEDRFPNELETTQVVVPSGSRYVREVLEDVIAQGADIVFTVTPQFMEDTLKVAIEHPEVKLLNCSLNTPHRYIRTYYGRMYEAKFLTGIIAGSLAENDHIGYIAEYPIFGAIANINAFALGAKLVNPRAKIYLQWSTVQESNMGEVFAREQIRYLSGQDFITPQSASREFGLYFRGESGPVNMAMPVWHWGIFYERLIQSILSGSWKRDEQESSKAYNYWWGISAGVIDVICSNNVPTETRRLVSLMRDAISKGKFYPFACELLDREGNVRNTDETRLSPEEIMKMDWLLDNVVGSIPTLEELKQEARPVVELAGLDRPQEELAGIDETEEQE